MSKVDVIIPTFRPGDKLEKLLERLIEQSVPVNRVIIMNTEEEYWDSERFESLFEGEKTKISVYHIRQSEFDHGRTRHEGILKSDADICICMTHDCVPYDRNLIKEMIEPFKISEMVAASYARQLPNHDCGVIERYTRDFNYPKEGRIKGKEDEDELGIKTYFCSNVCAAYRRDIYLKLGGFTRKTIFNEDMIFAGRAVEAGYQIVYASKAQVIHSHNYTALQQLHRNFDLGVSQADHPEIFARFSSEGEGIRLVKKTAKWLVENGYAYLLPKLVISSGSKYAGYRLGKHYKKLPKWMILKLTMNPAYWEGENDNE